MEESVKVPLASRVAPSIKDKVIQAAEEQGSTASAFVESVLVASFEKGVVTQSKLDHQHHVADDSSEEPDQFPQREGEGEVPGSSTEQFIEAEVDDENLFPDPIAGEKIRSDDPEEILVNNVDFQTKNLSKEKDILPEEEDDLLSTYVEFSPEGNEELSHYLSKLRAHYPNQSDEQLILGALFAAYCNEIKWGQYIVKSYLVRSEKQRRSLIPSENQEQ